MAVDAGVGGKREEVFRVGCWNIAGRLGTAGRRALAGATSKGRSHGCPYTVQETGGLDHPLPAQIWNRSLHGLLMYLESLALEGGICGEKWPLLIFGILFPCSFFKATGIYLVKKQLINLFDLHVEMNHIKFQVKSLSLVECLLNLLRFIPSVHGLLKVYLSSIF